VGWGPESPRWCGRTPSCRHCVRRKVSRKDCARPSGSALGASLRSAAYRTSAMHIEILKHPIKGFQVRVVDAKGRHLPHDRERSKGRESLDRCLRQLSDSRQIREVRAEGINAARKVLRCGRGRGSNADQGNPQGQQLAGQLHEQR
jgi:hypothetical protein